MTEDVLPTGYTINDILLDLAAGALEMAATGSTANYKRFSGLAGSISAQIKSDEE